MPRLTADTRIVARPLLDELTGDDGSVVLVSTSGLDSVIRLTSLGAAARAACEGGLRLEALATHLADLFGEPAEGGILAATALVVGSLEDVGLIDVDGGPSPGSPTLDT